MEMVIQVKMREMTKEGCLLLLQQTSLALSLTGCQPQSMRLSVTIKLMWEGQQYNRFLSNGSRRVLQYVGRLTLTQYANPPPVRLGVRSPTMALSALGSHRCLLTVGKCPLSF